VIGIDIQVRQWPLVGNASAAFLERRGNVESQFTERRGGRSLQTLRTTLLVLFVKTDQTLRTKFPVLFIETDGPSAAANAKR
jgi:hypothetical protein